jgi:hypothetical protein
VAHLLARLISGEFVVGHAGEIVPAAVILGDVIEAEMPIFVHPLTAFGRAVGAGLGASYVIASVLLRRLLHGFAHSCALSGLLDADVNELGAIGEVFWHVLDR